jgi:DNA polymerase-1
MGCYSIAACRDDIEVVLATNDKDLYQLVGPCVKVYTTAKADLASPKDAFALLGEEEVTGKWGVPPALIGDVLAIAGDTVDNIPGIGIGRKTAAGLIREHGGLEALLAILPPSRALKTREKLQSGREQILQNRKMVELDCKTDLPVAINRLPIRPDYPGLIAALEKCEFKSLLQEVREEAARPGCHGPRGAEAIRRQKFFIKTREFRTVPKACCQIRQVKAIRVVRTLIVFAVSPWRALPESFF